MAGHGPGNGRLRMTPANVMTTIRNGTYLGECVIYCNEHVVVTPETEVYTLTSPYPDPEHPDIRVEERTDPAEWSGLLALVDWDALQALPRTIGLPDASDAGGELVEISDGQQVKRVD